MTAEDFMEILENENLEPYRYSGRGMYGRQCPAFNSIFIYAALVALAAKYHDDVDFLNVLKHVRTDSMGLDTVCYFPDVIFAIE